MKITKVTYQKAFVIGPYLQEKVGFEAEIDGTCESEKEALSALKKTSEEWHIENNPQIYQQISPAPPTELPIINKAEERLAIEIENCKTVEELKEFYSKLSSPFLVDTFWKHHTQLAQNK